MKLHRNFIDTLSDWSQLKALSILGPTGSGKTSMLLAFLRKNHLSPLLVSLDSVAAYCELDVGSSKPVGADFSEFEWAGINIVSPEQEMSASIMRNAIRSQIDAAQKQKRLIVFVGGTHFYERFVLEGAAPGEASDPEFIEYLKQLGREKVLQLLGEKDSRWRSFLHVNDEFRVFRYGDLVLRQLFDYDVLRAGSQNPLFETIDCLILESPPSELEKTLALRIEDMFRLGWLEETAALVAKYSTQAPALRTVGYREIVEFLKLHPSPKTASAELKHQILIRHRQLAKQQRTWLRKLRSQAAVG